MLLLVFHSDLIILFDCSYETELISVLRKEIFELIFSRHMPRDDAAVLVATAETVIRMVCSPCSDMAVEDNVLENVIRTGNEGNADFKLRLELEASNFPKLLLMLLSFIERNVSSKNSFSRVNDENTEKEKAFIATLLLVLIRRVWCESSSSISGGSNATEISSSVVTERKDNIFTSLPTLPAALPLHFTRYFLQLLRGSKAFLQDICRAGLCWCFHLARSREDAASCLAVSVEVTTALMRERKAAYLPPGAERTFSFVQIMFENAEICMCAQGWLWRAS